MANDFGLRVGVDGESEFKRALRELNSSMKTLGSEAKLVASEFDKNDNSVEALTARSKVLTKQIEEQDRKIGLLADALKNAKEQYGENSTQANNWQRQLNEAQAEANTMRRELDRMTESIEDATRAEQDGTRATDKYSDSMDDVEGGSQNASKGIAGFAESAKSSAAAFVAAATAVAAAVAAVGKALISTSVQGAQYADNLLTQSKVTGISVEKLQELTYSAELVDVSVDTLTSTMRRNIMAMQNAQRGTEQYVQAYEALGVSITDKSGKLRDSEDVYWDLIEALGKVENLTERDALAMTIFGRSAQDLNPLIEAGADTMAAFAKEAHEVGYILDTETIGAYGKLDDAIQRLTNAQTAAKNAIGLLFLPELQSLSDKGTKWLQEFAKAANDAGGDTEKMAEAFGSVVDGAMDDLAEELPAITDKAVMLVSALAAGIGEHAPEILETLGKALLKGLGNYFTENFWKKHSFTGLIIDYFKKKKEEEAEEAEALHGSSWRGGGNNDSSYQGKTAVPVIITDQQIGQANQRYAAQYGTRVTEGVYADGY